MCGLNSKDIFIQCTGMQYRNGIEWQNGPVH